MAKKRREQLDPKTLRYVAAVMRKHGGEVQRFAGPRAVDLWVYILRLEAAALEREPLNPRPMDVRI